MKKKLKMHENKVNFVQLFKNLKTKIAFIFFIQNLTLLLRLSNLVAPLILILSQIQDE